MKKKIMIFCLLAPLVLTTLCGCVPLLVGSALGVAALGGYSISKDSIQGDSEIPYEDVWDSALKISKIRGTIKEENASMGCLKLEAEGSYVWVEVIKLTGSVTRLRVAARKLHLPNIKLAQDFFVKIMEDAQ